MAEPGLPDVSWLQSEAHNRWLQPNEIAQILHNHKMLPLWKNPPVLPCSGSVFIYDRRVTRYYRNDGHKWEMRSHGKAINESHIKLKVENDDVLDGYYARGAQNSNFRRRCYSLCEPLDLKHIVFVHYLNVKLDASKGLSERRTQGANVKRKLESSCSLFDCQNEQPAKRAVVAQMDPATGPFGSESIRGNISCSLAMSEPSLDKEQADFQNLVIAAFECQEGVVSFENDETPHLGGPPYFTSVPGTMGLPRTENSDSSRLSALNEMGTLAYAQTSASLSDHGSLHPAGVSCGFNDYEFGQIEIVGLRNNPSSSFLREVSSPLSCDIAAASTTAASCKEGHFPFTHTGCQSEELDNLVKTILLEFATWYAKTRWTKVSGVLKLFSVRKVVAVKGVFEKKSRMLNKTVKICS